MAVHESLDMALRTGSASDSIGRWIPVAGRVGDDYPWTITADVGDVGSGGVTVRVEAGPARDDTAVVTLYTFAARSAPAQDRVTVTLSGWLENGWLRSIANVNGAVHVGTREEAFFFSVQAEEDRLSERVRGWDAKVQEAKKAERDLLGPYRGRGYYGYALEMARPAFANDLRDAIAEQMDHRFQLWALGKSQDPSSKVTLRDSNPVDRTARAIVARYGPVVHL